MTSPAHARPVLLVGSVPLASATQVFESVGSTLGGLAKRISDGETGPRAGWIAWQVSILTKTDGLEIANYVSVPGMEQYKLPRMRPKAGLKPADIVFPPLGYAAAARESYENFKQARTAGKFPADTRFQVSLPTPFAVVQAFFVEDVVHTIWPVYEAKMFNELDEITRSIPHSDLAIQWDVAVEIITLEVAAGAASYMSQQEAKLYPRQEILDRLVRCCERVPSDVELGIHFCYGDPGHKHLVDPKDLTLLVELANYLSAKCARVLNWIHMPIPHDRDDDVYFAPLQNLKLRPQTELYLGLVHLTDGVAGARRRIASASRAVKKFGIATECGFGRRPPETVPALLALHRDIAQLGE
jgi:hypothetical protein